MKQAEQNGTTISNEVQSMLFQQYSEYHQGFIENTDCAYATSFTTYMMLQMRLNFLPHPSP
ncbi:hypothetical protein RDI58_004248 [Solanum bulbocastanum]|uniref:Uncharacterized protein n=1 Tax=Solanum bulbocastanum TaxID=147425 RepID=A0AAN8U661_SOLBU